MHEYWSIIIVKGEASRQKTLRCARPEGERRQSNEHLEVHRWRMVRQRQAVRELARRFVKRLAQVKAKGGAEAPPRK